MAPLFLDIERVFRLHRTLIEHYGGEEGVRDVGLLHSALAMSQTCYGGDCLHADLFEMTASVSWMSAAAVVFLAINDVMIENDEEGLVELTLSVATGQIGKAEIAAFFRERSR